HPEEREAALLIAGRLWRYVDVVSTAMAYAYVDEITDRGLLNRDLLESLLAGHGEDERVRRLARMLHRRLGDDHVVVVIRGDGVPIENSRERLLPSRIVLDHIVDAARTSLRPAVAPSSSTTCSSITCCAPARTRGGTSARRCGRSWSTTASTAPSSSPRCARTSTRA